MSGGARWLGVAEEKSYGKFKDLLSANTNKTGFPKKVLVTVNPASTYFHVGMKILIRDSVAYEFNTVSALPGGQEITVGTDLTNDYTTANGAYVAVCPADTLAHTGLDMNPDQGTLFFEESTSRVETGGVPGPFVESGTTSFLLRPDVVGKFLKWAFGTCVSQQISSSAMYKHTFTVGNTLKSAILVDGREAYATWARWITGALLKRLTIEAPARGIATGEIEVQGQWESLHPKPAMLTTSGLRPFVFYDGNVYFDDVLLSSCQSCKLEYTNNIPDDTQHLGERIIPSVVLGGSECKGEFEQKWYNWDLRRKYYGALVGGQEPTEPQIEGRYFKIELRFLGEPTGVPAWPYYQLNYIVNKALLQEHAAEVPPRDPLMQSVTYKGMILAADDIKIELYNKITSYDYV